MNKKLFFSTILMVLVFGMTVVGCGNSDGAITLTENKWAVGEIKPGVSERVYSFKVATGRSYYIWVNDYDGDDTYTADVDITAYHSNGGELFSEEDENWDYPVSFVASANGKVTIRVAVGPNRGGNKIGTFAIVYSTNNNRPKK
jgi:hypothetical protein